jgi:nucleoside-diphosphate-sugar epimerase
MKALVTGCAGFIESHLVERLLKEGFEENRSGRDQGWVLGKVSGGRLNG